MKWDHLLRCKQSHKNGIKLKPVRYFCVENSVKQLIAVVTSQQTYSYSQHSHMPFTHPSSNRSVQMFCISSHKIAINFLFGLKISVCVMRQWRNSSIETQWHVLYPLRLACKRSFFFSFLWKKDPIKTSTKFIMEFIWNAKFDIICIHFGCCYSFVFDILSYHE